MRSRTREIEESGGTHEVLVRSEILIVVQRSVDAFELRLIVANSGEKDDGDDVVGLESRPASEEFGKESMLVEKEDRRSGRREESDLARKGHERLTRAFS